MLGSESVSGKQVDIQTNASECDSDQYLSEQIIQNAFTTEACDVAQLAQIAVEPEFLTHLLPVTLYDDPSDAIQKMYAYQTCIYI